MDCKAKIKELRESTGMNRKEFCDYFLIEAIVMLLNMY